jgi:hypothetical protein
MPKCRICKTKFTPTRALQPTCSDNNCMYQFAVEHAKKVAERNKKAEKKVLKEKVKTLSDFLKELQTNINAIVRLIDKGCGCICTDSKNGKKNAGHYRSVQSHPSIRFHLDNIHLQSEHSNTYRSGDTLRYQAGLKKVYGEDYFEYVNSLSLIQPIKLNKDELKEKISITKEIIKELKANDLTYDVKERIELRKKYNEKLGIYPLTQQ